MIMMLEERDFKRFCNLLKDYSDEKKNMLYKFCRLQEKINEVRLEIEDVVLDYLNTDDLEIDMKKLSRLKKKRRKLVDESFKLEKSLKESKAVDAVLEYFE